MWKTAVSIGDLARLIRNGFLLGSALLVSGCPTATVSDSDIVVSAVGAPPDYYDSVDSSDPSALRRTLHEVIDDHTRIVFSSTRLDTFDVLEVIDQDPDDPNRIWEIYGNASMPKNRRDYNREHTWPTSYGFPDDNQTNYPFSDLNALFLSDSSLNSARGNQPYRSCNSTCDELATVANQGRGGGVGTYPGNSNWDQGNNTGGTWETWIGRRGDVARALFYMDVRYEGGTHGGTGAREPDLILTDDEQLIAASKTGRNERVGYMGMLATLLRWHIEDPVDDAERARADLVFGTQDNRNPFIDHPEWVACIFQGECGDTAAPGAPVGLSGQAGHRLAELSWGASSATDLIGYFVYRGTRAAGPFTKVNHNLKTDARFNDASVANGTTYYYAITAVDTSGNESARSAVVSVRPTSGAGSGVFINEFHYDNRGADVGEIVEIAGPAGLDLRGWSVLGYNGNDGTAYRVVPLAGNIPDQGGCMGTLVFDFGSMQNGGPDGLALVDSCGAVMDFISYEGAFTAQRGPASGRTSTDVGQVENGSTNVGFSLSRSGTGSRSVDFGWSPAGASSHGAINRNQIFDGCSSGCSSDAQCDDGLVCNGAETCAGGACQAGAPLVCNDGLACTFDQCEEGAGGCTFSPDDSACDDGLFCNGVETCDGSSGCLASAPPCGGACDEAADQCLAIGGAWINELHYDNVSSDANEGVEIAGPAGLDLSGWQLVGYNGNNGSDYRTTNLSGTIPAMQNGFGVLWFDIAGIQNGPNDGVALVDRQGVVQQFISYEGVLDANDGPAVSQRSVDIGVRETSSTGVQESLQLEGSGSQAEDFQWRAPSASSRGAINAGQTLGQ